MTKCIYTLLVVIAASLNLNVSTFAKGSSNSVNITNADTVQTQGVSDVPGGFGGVDRDNESPKTFSSGSSSNSPSGRSGGTSLSNEPGGDLGGLALDCTSYLGGIVRYCD